MFGWRTLAKFAKCAGGRSMNLLQSQKIEGKEVEEKEEIVGETTGSWPGGAQGWWWSGCKPVPRTRVGFDVPSAAAVLRSLISARAPLLTLLIPTEGSAPPGALRL